MDQLPTELLQRVFAHLDVESLKNTALCCRTFFHAFKGAEALITGEALLRQIDYDVLPEAILVSKSWSLGKPSLSKGIEFAVNFGEREPAPTKWKLADALGLARFHEKVSYLAIQAAHEALQKQPRLLAIGAPAEPTREEMCRFERALYRFQLYCNVVGRLYLKDQEYEDIFFKYFCAWENEQLACINEHLLRVVSRPLNYFVDHDITWGFLQILYTSAFYADHAQYIMSEGLERIYFLSRASGYAQYHALLSRGEHWFAEPLPCCCFLGHGLELGADPEMDPFTALSNMDDYDKKLVINIPFYEDPDPGPALMWEWIYRGEWPGSLVANSSMRVHRLWAFPFWDHSRLQAAGLLGDPEIGPARFSDPELEEYATDDRQKFLDDTQKARREIYYGGGCGYYDPEDLSQVKRRDQETQKNTRRGARNSTQNNAQDNAQKTNQKFTI